MKSSASPFLKKASGGKPQTRKEMKKGGLGGRGVLALVGAPKPVATSAARLAAAVPEPVAPAAEARSGVVEVIAADIERSPWQARGDFDESALKELADSIRANGIVQPPVVRRRPDGKYELIAGERRTRAAIMAGLKKIPVQHTWAYTAELNGSELYKINLFKLNPFFGDLFSTSYDVSNAEYNINGNIYKYPMLGVTNLSASNPLLQWSPDGQSWGAATVIQTPTRINLQALNPVFGSGFSASYSYSDMQYNINLDTSVVALKSDLSNYASITDLASLSSSISTNTSNIANLTSQITDLASLTSSHTSQISTLTSNVANCVKLSQLSAYSPTSSFASVAFTGAYSDLSGLPTIHSYTLSTNSANALSSASLVQSYETLTFTYSDSTTATFNFLTTSTTLSTTTLSALTSATLNES